FFFSSRRRHTSSTRDWSSDVCSSDLAHHGGIAWRRRVSLRLVFETLLVLGFWIVLVVRQPRVFLMAYLPGYLAGLALCALQGHRSEERRVGKECRTVLVGQR